MGEFNLRADSVNVEQIMQQIRARIREKRGVDYTEQQIRELAAVKLERFLDPGSVRSDLLQHFQQGFRHDLPNFTFEDSTLFDSHRPPVRWLRQLLKPFLKLLVNLNPLIHALHIQSKINAEMGRSFQQHAELSYEVMHNLVVELTRLSIETRNLKMRVESLTNRLEFDERRARALEGVVQYKGQPPQAAEPAVPDETGEAERPDRPEGEGTPAEARTRARRRRRRGRRNAPRPGERDEAASSAPGGGDAPKAGGGTGERDSGADQSGGQPEGGAPTDASPATGEADRGPGDRSGPGDQDQ